MADVFSPISSSLSPSSTPATEMKRQHLTLEEKQRLAKAKEQEFMMKKQGPLKPKQSSLPQKKKVCQIYVCINFLPEKTYTF